MSLTDNWNTVSTDWHWTYDEPGVAVNPAQERTLLKILSILVEREGGRIVVTEKELEEAPGRVLMSQDEVAGLRFLDILPDYIAIGEEPTPKATGTIRKTVKVPGLPNSGSVTFNNGPYEISNVVRSQRETQETYTRVQERLRTLFSEAGQSGSKENKKRGR